MKEQIDLELKNKLYDPLPAESISAHPTKTYLSSIKAIYVTDRLNNVFGIGKWTQKVSCEHVNHDTGMVVVKVIFEVPDMNIYYESFGGNDNGSTENKNFDLGDAFKGATTDALTKIGSYLGIGIDVFKGKNKPDNKDKPDDKDKTPIIWLKDKQVQLLVSNKDHDKINKALSWYDCKTKRTDKDGNIVKYGISKTNKTKLQNTINK